MCRAKTLKLFNLCVVIMLLILSLLMINPVLGQQSTSLNGEPHTQIVTPGETTYIDFVVVNAELGIGAYYFNASIKNPEHAKIIGFERPNTPALIDNTSIIRNNTSIRFEDALGDNVYPSGEQVKIGSITVKGMSLGETEIELDPLLITSTDGRNYELTSIQNPNIRVANAPYYVVNIDEGDISDEMVIGEQSEIIAEITNTGTASTAQNIELIINDEVVANKEVSIDPGRSEKTIFSYTPREDSDREVEATVKSANTSSNISLKIVQGETFPLTGYTAIITLVSVALISLATSRYKLK